LSLGDGSPRIALDATDTLAGIEVAHERLGEDIETDDRFTNFNHDFLFR
jgi:hypothetical protein